jgi:tRNA dimethylallyltransferase
MAIGTSGRHGDVLVIVGPTAIGKTALSLELAPALDGEIISADSRQVYRGMDIGTAKPTAAERAGIPHHGLDVVWPDEPFNLVDFLTLADGAVRAAHARGRLPIIVGGTGLYIWGFVRGFDVPRVPPQPDLRAALEQRARQHGPESLYAELRQRDPAAAQRIDPRNIRRVIRALEVLVVAGRSIAERRSAPPPYRFLIIGLDAPRDELYRRIDARVDGQMAAGLLEETRWLAERYDWSLPSMSGLGYRQLGAYLRGACGLAEAVAQIKTQTHRFARQQYTWFRPGDPAIRWLAADGRAPERAYELIRDWRARQEVA